MSADDELNMLRARVAELEQTVERRTRLLRDVQDIARKLTAEAKGRQEYGVRLRARVAELEAAAKTARTEAIADAGNYLDEVGEKNAAYLLYTMDVPVAREMTPARQQENTHVSFAAVKVGDRVRFVTNDNGFGGQGEVWRTGTVAKVTAKTVVVDCDENLLGDTAVLRGADWNSRAVQHQVEDPHDGPLHHDYALGRDLPAIPHQTTGRCPVCGGTFEDCTCGGAA